MQNVDSKKILLTETVQKGGCAAKLRAGQLREVLARLNISKPKSLLVGTETMDDACLWDLGNGMSLVQTLDFFTPIVDDPYDFGAIAAANAISDVYAMGGSPKIALSILAFPSKTLPLEILQPLLKGALDKIEEAGACLAGGHTIDDDTLKFGLSVTGFVENSHAWTNANAKVGDVLILTKALGTGTITSALKNKVSQSHWIEPAILSMKQLNDVPSYLKGESINACTDITGFGLAGHALQMARASNVSFQIITKNLPCLPGAMQCLENKILNRAHQTNLDYVKSEVDFTNASEIVKWLTVDPQTSGGLLLAVPKTQADKVRQLLTSKFTSTSIIGNVFKAGSRSKIEFV